MGLHAHPPHHLIYSGKALLITGLEGFVRDGAEGYYFENTRFLSCATLEVDGRAPLPSGVAPAAGDGLLGYYVDEARGAPYSRPVVLTVRSFVDDGLSLVLSVENYSWQREYEPELSLRLDADFADVKEALQGRRQQEAEVERHWDARRRETCFRYLHPELDLGTTVRVEEGPGQVDWDGKRLRFRAQLAPRGSEHLRLAIEPMRDGQSRKAKRWSFADQPTGLRRLRQELASEAPRLRSSNATVSRAWDTAIEDLASLPLGLEQGPATPMAGLPAYHSLFGRDALTAAWQSLMAMPSVMKDTLVTNTAWRGRSVDDRFDEEPGKLLNRVNWGPIAQLGEEPFAHYYGDYATPLDFLIGFGQYLIWTNDRKTARSLLPGVREVLTWTERYADIDGDGFIEYLTRSDAHRGVREEVKNQGWKDAPDAIRDAEGSEVQPPIATCELQGYLYVGLRQTGQALLQLGERGRSLELFNRARKLKERFNEVFWMEDEGFYSLGIGPDKEQIASVTSNPGHLLATGIVPRSRAGRVVERLMQEDMFSGWGIRTLSSAHPAFNPFSYHLGSVWPVENATIALGFARYGYWEAAQRVAEGIFSASRLYERNRLPEAFGGLARDDLHPHPGIYPLANSPQAWSASAIVLLVQTLLGLRAVAPAKLLLIDPHLPEWLPDLELHGLSLGSRKVDLRVWRDEGGRSRFETSSRGGFALTVRQRPAMSRRLDSILPQFAG